MSVLIRIAVISLAVLASSAAFAAETFPNRPIRMIVPYSPGGNVDISARTIGPGLTHLLGQQIVVDNRPGAGGIVGASLVAKAAADGYTLLVGSTGPLAVNPIVYPDLPYDPVKDFAPVGRVQSVTLVVEVGPNYPVKSIEALLARAKARPGGITMASAGTGTTNHFALALLSSMSGAKFLHVPYKGSGPALTALLGGQVNTMIDQLTSSINYIKDGRLKVLAVTAAERVSALPDVPTLAESGVKGYEASTFLGILAPAHTPAAVIDRLNATLNRVVAMPDVVERFRALGADPGGSTPAEFGRMIRTQLEKWRGVAKDAHLHFN